MDLEFATTFDIAKELANRGLQFIIAIEVKDNAGKGILLCVDGEKDQRVVAHSISPFFNKE